MQAADDLPPSSGGLELLVEPTVGKDSPGLGLRSSSLVGDAKMQGAADEKENGSGSLYMPSSPSGGPREMGAAFVAPSPVRSQGRSRGAARTGTDSRLGKHDVHTVKSIMTVGLLRLGDELELLGLRAIVLKDCWLEVQERHGESTCELIEFAMKAAKAARATPQVTADLRKGERELYQAVRLLRTGETLWEVSEACKAQLRRVGGGGDDRHVADVGAPRSSNADDAKDDARTNKDGKADDNCAMKDEGDDMLAFGKEQKDESDHSSLALSLSEDDGTKASQARALPPPPPPQARGQLQQDTQLPVRVAHDYLADLLGESTPVSAARPKERRQQLLTKVATAGKKRPRITTDGARAATSVDTKRSRAPQDVIVIDLSDDALQQQQQRAKSTTTPVSRKAARLGGGGTSAASGPKRRRPDEDSMAPELEAAREGLAQDERVLAILSSAVSKADAAAGDKSPPPMPRRHSSFLSAEQPHVPGPVAGAEVAHAAAVAEVGAAPSVAPRSIVAMCSGLNSAEIDSLRRLLVQLRGTLACTWGAEVTHVVMHTDSERGCKRTIKYMQGVLSGALVVAFDWVVACLGVRERVDEVPFLVAHDSAGGLAACRTMQLRLAPGGQRLFAGLKMVFVRESFGADLPFSLAELEATAAAGGAQVVPAAAAAAAAAASGSTAEYDPTVMVICADAALPELAESLWATHGHDGIGHTWIFDCASHATLLSSSKYKVTRHEEVLFMFPTATQHSPAV